MAIDLKKDWPIVAAVALGIIGLILLLRSRTEDTNTPVRIGGGGGADQSAAIQASAALEQGRAQTFGTLFSSLVGGLVRREEVQAQREVGLAQASAAVTAAQAQSSMVVEAARLQANAQIAAAQAQASAQQQSSLFGFLGGILPFIFCWEVTDAAVESRDRNKGNFALAYPELVAA